MDQRVNYRKREDKGVRDSTEDESHEREERGYREGDGPFREAARGADGPGGENEGRRGLDRLLKGRSHRHRGGGGRRDRTIHQRRGQKSPRISVKERGQSGEGRDQKHRWSIH